MAEDKKPNVINTTMKFVTLSDGRKIVVKRGIKGKDTVAAKRVISNPKDELELTYGLIAQVAEYEDGKPVLFEDVLEMEMDDILAIQEAIPGNFFRQNQNR